MSDTPQGDGWSQAPDQKWYPPAPDSATSATATSAAATPGRSRWILPAVALVVVALLAAGLTFVLTRDDEPDVNVVLEPAADVGPDPFTESVTTEEPAEFPDAVATEVSTTADGLSTDDDTGTLVAPGDTPGLFGGTRDDRACDTTALAAFLTDPANQAKADAWAGVVGIAPDEIEAFLDDLTPTVLTIDTRVTNHGFSGGRATERQAVLQAGTAVLVDVRGVPRVRCSCGNPLTEPSSVDLTRTATPAGAWTGYRPQLVATPAAAPAPIETFTLIDVTTGDTFERPPGASAGANWVAVSNSTTTTAGAATSEIHTSTDGATWETTATVPGSLRAVAHGDGVYVAVGEGVATTGGFAETGIVLTSTDGRTWSEPVAVEVPLFDVAWGDGRFLAISRNGSAGYDTGTQVVTSTDGATWTAMPAAPTESLGISESLTYRNGSFLLLGLSCGNGRNSPGCEPWYLLETTDGSAWSPSAMPVDTVGYIGEQITIGANDDAAILLSTDGSFALGAAAAEPAGPAPGFGPVAVSGSGSSWFAVGWGDGTTSASAVFRSDDLQSWTAVAEVADGLADVVVVGDVGSAATPASTTTTTAPTPAEGGELVVTEEGFQAGGQDVSTATTPASAARAALTAALGEPGQADPIGSGVCEPGVYRWGELEFVEFNEEYWYFSVSTFQPPVGPSVLDRTRTSGGIRFGDEDVEGAHPGAEVITTDSGDLAYFLDSDGSGTGLLLFVGAEEMLPVTSMSGGSIDPRNAGDC